jgi:hypothetical protein
MDNLNDIKNIWMTANVDGLPNAEEIIRTIKRYRLKHVVKNAIFILFILLLAAAMMWVVFMYKSRMWTTRIGEACFFIAMFMLLATKAGSLKRITVPQTNSNNNFIDFLKQEQQHQFHFFKRTQIVGFVFSAAGLILYIFESVHNDATTMTVAYSLLAIFLSAGWLILRPIAMRKKTARLNEMIEKLQELSTQLQTKNKNSSKGKKLNDKYVC